MATWLRGWTVFYWAWWISWTPFVGLFIARISRGRTIRQFVTGVLLVPSLVSLLWFAVFGGAGIAAQRSGVDVVGQGTTEGQLFTVLEQYPLATAATVLVFSVPGLVTRRVPLSARRFRDHRGKRMAMLPAAERHRRPLIEPAPGTLANAAAV